MADRTRPVRKEICLNETELNLIRHKMRQLGTRNFGAYARKMLIDGYIIKVDYTEQKKLAAAVNRIASNIRFVPLLNLLPGFRLRPVGQAVFAFAHKYHSNLR